MSDTPAQETAEIQRLLLRMAASVSTNTPLVLNPGETSESVNLSLIQALGMISRVGRLEAVAEAARPLANYLASTQEFPAEGYEKSQLQANVQQLLTALAALHAYDNREADHTVVD